MKNIGAALLITAVVALGVALMSRLAPRVDHASVPGQLVPTSTPTMIPQDFGGTGYFLSMPGSCPGTPLSGIPAQTSALQVNLKWDDIPTDKARFHLIESPDRQAMPLVDTELLFEREAGELYRCATVTRSITYTASGFTYFAHGLQAVDDQNGYVTVTPNPDDMNAWTFEAVETVQPIETATDPEYGQFSIEVQSLPVVYTRPDQTIQDPPVDEFTTNDTVYLLQPPPCVSDYVRFEAIGPSGFHWESPEGVFCRSYSVSVFEIGTALTVGDYVVMAKNEGTGDIIAQWQFSVSQ